MLFRSAIITKGVSIALPTGLGTAITDSVSSSTAKKAAKDAGKQAAADIAASANSGLWLSLTKGISNAIKAMKVDSAAAKKKADEIKKVLGDALGTAFGTFSSKALRAYDAETQTLTDKLRSDLSDQLQAIEDTLTASSDRIRQTLKTTLGALSAQEATLTPAEQAYKDAVAARDKERALRELTKAQQDLTDAQMSGDQAAITQAQQNLADIVTSQAIDALQAQADEERRIKNEQYQQMRDDAQAAADQQIADLETQAAKDKKIAQANTDDAILQLQAERDLRREQLDAQLQDIEENLQKHPALYQKYHDQVMALFADSFGPDFQTAGLNLGRAYATGLEQAQSAVAAAAAKLAAAATPGAAPSAKPAGAASSQNAVNVTVNAGIGTNGSQVGAQVLQVLRDYSKQNGSIGFGVGLG